MRGKIMEWANFWLPIVGGALLLAVAISAWFADKKVIAIWFGFGGAICFCLLAALQLQEIVGTEEAQADPADRPWIGVSGIDMGPLAVGDFRAVVQLRNTGVGPAAKVRARIDWLIVPGSGAGPPIPATFIPENLPVTLIPNTDFPLQLYGSNALTAPAVTAISSGNSKIWLTGRVEYFDRKGHRHNTTFKGVYVPSAHKFAQVENEAD